MNIAELKEAKSKLENDVVVLIKKFEKSTTTKIRSLYLNVPASMRVSYHGGDEDVIVSGSEMKCEVILDL